MSLYVAFTFGSTQQAANARGVLRTLENRNQLGLYDAVVLTKDGEGSPKRRRDWSGAPIIGAMVGALAGLVLAPAFPILSVLLGAGVGGLLGVLLCDQRIEEAEIANVARRLRPGTSGLLLLISSGDIATLGLSLRPFDLHVCQSSLPPDLHATLRWSLRH